ncbi:MAG: hypothetical protein KGL01_00090, partial [Betaproteobacteria bacterium]|nr:hypothetical protein [Betaproteobacteria bacterium]
MPGFDPHFPDDPVITLPGSGHSRPSAIDTNQSCSVFGHIIKSNQPCFSKVSNCSIGNGLPNRYP